MLYDRCQTMKQLISFSFSEKLQLILGKMTCTIISETFCYVGIMALILYFVGLALKELTSTDNKTK